LVQLPELLGLIVLLYLVIIVRKQGERNRFSDRFTFIIANKMIADPECKKYTCRLVKAGRKELRIDKFEPEGSGGLRILVKWGTH
jgi:hypothetical protein